MANLPRSQAIHFLSSFSETAGVVPEPEKKSATRSSLFEETFTIFSIKAIGFCVAYSVLSSAALFIISIIHQSLGATPALLSI